ncbi:flagellar motor protein MotB [Alisedimentitalea sp. MJ-SS2]|uniref:flagellar motor protein MotB n=1 Tax=Aliisedimentitalea sp. MJ-SS2 TaxID=3049795 RepID=UPI002906F78E|nr:flagellar motor protein MotB [Alisedimentitalea sp. MJ-SS2]MDU8929630.1 flagellar motor protein MotB [Alisedimentitalea sp. MJ-SS2]
MSAQSNAAPVIIKRKKVISGGRHHGGAWKAAYADFVTAMMAFFLLMWLLNATTEKQRKGVADYFSPTVPINRVSGGGEGAFGGESVFSEKTLPQNGTGASNRRPTEANQARGETGVGDKGQDASRGDCDAEAFELVEEMLLGRGGESMATEEALKHIITRVTDEGLVIELFDLDDVPLFDPDTTTPTQLLHDLAGMLARVIPLVENKVAIGGHTRSQPVVLANNPIWDLSSARANAMRLLLEKHGLDNERVRRVTGHADNKPQARNPMDVRNNRIEVILLREP